MPVSQHAPQYHPLVRHVAHGLRRRCGVREGDAVIVAVSGGADSVALLRALTLLAPRRRWRLRLAVAHVQHHLRGEAAEEDAEFVQGLAKALDLPYHRRDLSWNGQRGNIEANARQMRYAALADIAAEWEQDSDDAGDLTHRRKMSSRAPSRRRRPGSPRPATSGTRSGSSPSARSPAYPDMKNTRTELFRNGFLATAHHADDQLETLLLRLLRGTGVRGLRGIGWRRTLESGSLVIRPMLAATHDEAVEFLRTLGQPWREDATNADSRRARARLRREVLPVLRDMRPSIATQAVRLADRVRDLLDEVNASPRP